MQFSTSQTDPAELETLRDTYLAGPATLATRRAAQAAVAPANNDAAPDAAGKPDGTGAHAKPGADKPDVSSATPEPDEATDGPDSADDEDQATPDETAASPTVRPSAVKPGVGQRGDDGDTGESNPSDDAARAPIGPQPTSLPTPWAPPSDTRTPPTPPASGSADRPAASVPERGAAGPVPPPAPPWGAPAAQPPAAPSVPAAPVAAPGAGSRPPAPTPNGVAQGPAGPAASAEPGHRVPMPPWLNQQQPQAGSQPVRPPAPPNADNVNATQAGMTEQLALSDMTPELAATVAKYVQQLKVNAAKRDAQAGPPAGAPAGAPPAPMQHGGPPQLGGPPQGEPAWGSVEASAAQFDEELATHGGERKFVVQRGRREGPKQGWRSAVSRLGIPIGKGAAEQAYDHDIAKINKRLRERKTVGVVAFKGGVGKTSMTVSLASTVAAHRQGGAVVAVDTVARGSLTLRIKGEQPAGGDVRALANDPHLERINDVQAHLMTNAHRLSVLGSHRDLGPSALTGQEYLRAVEQLHRHHDIVFVDTEPSVATPAYEVIMRSLDALILVVNPTRDSAVPGREVLPWLRARGLTELVSRTIVLLNHQSPAKPCMDQEVITNHFHGTERVEVLEIPYDEHLAEASPISLELLNKTTRRWLVRAAAVLLDKLPAN